MRHLIIILLLLLPVLSNAQWTAKVVGVHDGDTFTVLEDNKQTKVRLRSIDCPELGQPFGRNAKQFTSDQVFNTTVVLTDTARDRYGRLLATVHTKNREDLNGLLLKHGLAWHYKKYDTSAHYAQLEAEAKNNKIGLWAEEATAPWAWRKLKK